MNATDVTMRMLLLTILFIFRAPALTASAFLPQHHWQKASVSLRDTEESEWYSPPPKLQPLPPAPPSSRVKISQLGGEIDLQEFFSEDERLCLVLFHASWCKACQKVCQIYQKLAHLQGDAVDQGHVVRPGKIRLATLEWGAHTELCQSQGVTKVLRQGAKLDGFAISPHEFASRVPSAIQRLLLLEVIQPSPQKNELKVG